MITPNDIETKVFSYSVRGYNKREVDEFLDQIMIDYQALLDQNAKMLERVHVLQKQVTEAKDPARMSDISASAEQKAEVIIENAKHDAENIVKNAKNSTSQADEDAERLRQKVEKFKLRFKQMLEDEMERVDDTSEDLLDDLRKDFYPAFLYGNGEAADYTKVAPSTPAEDLIADLPDVEPEDEIDAVEAEAAEMGEEGQGALDEELDQEVTEEAEAVGAAEAEDIVPDESAGDTETEEGPEIEVYEENQEEEELETSDEADEAKEETAGEEKAEDAAESVDDPLLARAKDANVNLDDLPGFRSSASSMDDTVVLKKLKNDNTVDLTSDME